MRSRLSLILGLLVLTSISVHGLVDMDPPSPTPGPTVVDVMDTPPPTQAPAVVDASSPLGEMINAISPIDGTYDPSLLLKWLANVGNVMDRVATGGLSSMPPQVVDALQMLSTSMTENPSWSSDKEVLNKLIDMIPSIWKSGFWYGDLVSWKPLVTPIFMQITNVTKSMNCETTYQHLINSTSLMIRFTKDNIFTNGVDDGRPLTTRMENMLAYLSELVSCTSQLPSFTLNCEVLRTYMNTIPSKKDGMNLTASFPTYVDTAKYAASDATSLQAFLTSEPE